MCGLLALVCDPDRSVTEEIVDAVAGASHLMRHRGPDEPGTWSDGQVVLGFNRLSIIDIAHSHQPLRWGPPESPNRYALVFNGEIYNYLELREELRAEFGAEFAAPSLGGFDRVVNGLNRLPRPMLAFGTIGLFVYAMIDPASFAARMVGLNAVPEPLWWLLGAVVAFYFGARETFYFRNRPGGGTVPGAAPASPGAAADDNAALSDWRAGG